MWLVPPSGHLTEQAVRYPRRDEEMGLGPSQGNAPVPQLGPAGRGVAKGPGGAARLLLQAAQACEGFSGRILRKLPFLAHAGHLGASPPPVDLTAYLEALLEASRKEAEDREAFLRIE